MATSRYAVVRRLSRVFLLPLHGHTLNDDGMRRRQGKETAAGRDKRLCTKENCLTCCKKFTAFMFSRVGLFLVMIGYVAFGGWLFRALEAGNELNVRRAMSRELNSTLDKLWYEILRINSYPYMDKRGNFTLYAAHELETFETTIIQQVQQGFDGRALSNSDAKQDWDYSGAILYAVTLISTIGYGHITTKTTQGKVATILYSAFGVPLMMLFVANIGSTMAKMFAFVFSRLTMLFCCRMSNKKKRAAAMALKNARKMADHQNQHTTILEGKPPGPIVRSTPNETTSKDIPSTTALPITTKSNLKRTKDDKGSMDKVPLGNDRSPKLRFETLSNSSPSASHVSLVSAATDVDGTSTTADLRQLPADVRLNMLTGAPHKRSTSTSTTRSVASSTGVVGERSKDAIFRINELIRQNSVQDVEDDGDDDVILPSIAAASGTDNRKRRQSAELSPIEFYINETNKLTSNLDSPSQLQSAQGPTSEMQQQLLEQSKLTVNTNDDEANMQQISIDPTPPVTNNVDNKQSVDESKKASKKKLKRSKSESTHNRRSRTKEGAPLATGESVEPTENESTNTAATKPSRRRFFLRKNPKLKKQAVVEEEKKETKPESTSPLHRPTSAVEVRQVNETKSGLTRKSQSFTERSRPTPPPPAYEESTTNEIGPLPPTTATVTWKAQDQLHTTNATFDHTANDDEDDDDFYEDEQMSVPLVVTVFVIPLYLTLGAILFNIWEKWGFLNSFYFCFITLTTIGFGDFVPGSSLRELGAKQKLISAALYILLGLVLIAMCFNLMKEQMSQKVKRVAGKWGIHES